MLERLASQGVAGGPLWSGLFAPVGPILLFPAFFRALWGPRMWKGRQLSPGRVSGRGRGGWTARTQGRGPGRQPEQ